MTGGEVVGKIKDLDYEMYSYSSGIRDEAGGVDKELSEAIAQDRRKYDSWEDVE